MKRLFLTFGCVLLTTVSSFVRSYCAQNVTARCKDAASGASRLDGVRYASFDVLSLPRPKESRRIVASGEYLLLSCCIRDDLVVVPLVAGRALSMVNCGLLARSSENLLSSCFLRLSHTESKAGEMLLRSKVGDGTVRSIDGDAIEVPLVEVWIGEKTGTLVSCDLPFLRWKVGKGDVGDVGVDLLLPARLIPAPQSVILRIVVIGHLATSDFTPSTSQIFHPAIMSRILEILRAATPNVYV